MSRSIKLSEMQRLALRLVCRNIRDARLSRNWTFADSLRNALLAVDNGMKICFNRDNKVSLWHWPNPPFTDHLHYCNFGEFIANSEEN